MTEHALVALILQDALQQQSSGNFEKNKGVLFTSHGNYTAQLGPEGRSTGREREREPATGWDSAFLGSRVGPRVLRAHSLWVNLKHKSGDLKHREEKRQVA